MKKNKTAPNSVPVEQCQLTDADIIELFNSIAPQK